MKRLFRKRAVALLADGFVFAIFYELLRRYITVFVSITDSWGYFIVFIPLILRDLCFRNCSVGKKLTGLIVVDDKWSVPSVSTVAKRSAVATLGHVLLFRFKVHNKSWKMACHDELEWEYSQLNARVVEKKVFMALKEKASVNGVLDITKMDQLYEEHLYS